MRHLISMTGGTADPSALPQGDGVISAKEYTFDVPALTAGKKQLVLRNDGPNEIHMAACLEFPAGVDEAGAMRALQAFASAEGPPPGIPEPEEGAFRGVLDVGRAQTSRPTSNPGRAYAMACFIPDRAGGPPHVAKGVVKTFPVRLPGSRVRRSWQEDNQMRRLMAVMTVLALSPPCCGDDDEDGGGAASNH